jgi:hypothetical protein
MNWIIENLSAWDSGMVLLLYWVPLALCVCGYSVDFVRLYRQDLAARAGFLYVPKLTVGWVLSAVAVALLPVINLSFVACDVAPRVFRGFSDWMGKVLNIPLVPKRKKNSGDQ